MEQREWRREMKETQGKTGRHKSNTTHRQNKPVFQYKQRGKKKNQKFTRGPFILSRKKKKEKV
jgi:hypothetical protein